MNIRWTVLVYLAANNELDPFARQAIHEMEQTGSTDSLTMVVFADFRRVTGDGKARRGKVVANPKWDKYDNTITTVFEEIGSVNTGDPAVLADFIAWGVTKYPADHFGLVLWGHGSGWKPDFVYQAVEKAGGTQLALAMRSADFADRYDRVSRLLFRPALDEAIASFIHQSFLPQLSLPARVKFAAEIASRNAASAAHPSPFLEELETSDPGFQDLLMRAIAYDETSHQGLDSKALRTALQDGAARVSAQSGQPLVWTFIGFDACMMAGIEVCSEIAALSHLIVGSEEIEPGRGWDYGLLMKSLLQGDAEDLPHLGKTCVGNYISALSEYKIRLVTQSAVDPTLLSEAVQEINALGRYLRPMISTDYVGLARAEKTATRFYDLDYIDIGNYLANLAVSLTGTDKQPIRNAVSAYQKTVLASAFAFANATQQPTGLSLYYPAKPSFDATYQTLSAASQLGDWISFVKAYHFLDQSQPTSGRLVAEVTERRWRRDALAFADEPVITQSDIRRRVDEDIRRRTSAHQANVARLLSARESAQTLRLVVRNKPLVLLALGDSWFDYPLTGNGLPLTDTDTIAQLRHIGDFPPIILDLAHHGDAATQEVSLPKQERFIAALREPSNWPDGKPDAILVSAGGNDIAGDEFCIFLDFNDGRTSGLNQQRFSKGLEMVEACYLELFAIRDRISAGTRIFGHCYDFPNPNGVHPYCAGPWLKPSLDFCNWTVGEGRQIVRDALIAFRAMLKRLADDPSNNFSLVETQGILGEGDWANELHPQPGGFEKVAEQFAKALQGTFGAGLVK